MDKKTIRQYAIFFTLSALSSSLFATAPQPRLIREQKAALSIPNTFLGSSETTSWEWGCPVQNRIEAASQADALKLMSQACMAEAEKEVRKKPGVYEVIKTSIIWPDVDVKEDHNSFILSGTFFLETVVLKTSRR